MSLKQLETIEKLKTLILITNIGTAVDKMKNDLIDIPENEIYKLINFIY